MNITDSSGTASPTRCERCGRYFHSVSFIANGITLCGLCYQALFPLPSSGAITITWPTPSTFEAEHNALKIKYNTLLDAAKALVAGHLAWLHWWDGREQCKFCGEPVLNEAVIHKPDCPVAQVKKLAGEIS